jgi:hypothetical protein
MVRRSVLSGFAILVPLFATVAPSFAEDECQATIIGTLMREEPSATKTVYTAKVDVETQQACAVVSFDLIIVEEAAGGEQTEVRVPKQVKVRDATPTSLKLDYELKQGRTIVSHRFEQTGCEICE